MGTDSDAGKSAKPAPHPLLRGYLEHLANERRLSRHTIDFHLRQIYCKLGISSRVELTRLVLEHAA